MKQKLFLFLFLILIVVTLVGLNAASYVQKEKMPDSELSPNRSTYNTGATGTQALYSLLSETGRKVVRWQEPPSALTTSSKNAPAVFVVIGKLRREFAEDEFEPLLRWVSGGGRLVLIDREPPHGLVTTTANWQIRSDDSDPLKFLSVDPSDQNQMTADTPAIKPVQPTIFTHSINAIQPSRFAATILFDRFDEAGASTGQGSGIGTGEEPPPPPRKLPTEDKYRDDPGSDPSPDTEPTEDPPNGPIKKRTKLYTLPSPTPIDIKKFVVSDSSSQSAPVVHVGSGSKNLLVEAPFGEGKIVFLADPFIVSNAGIGLVDNAQLAINMLAAGDSPIAFDEYHQGYGANNNKFLEFFEGTPIVAIFLQCLLLVGFVFFSQSRRFARAVPEPEADRLSKLEYVSAMAELQERSYAFDLAIENIYHEFRRRAARLLGADNYTVRYDELAKLISERTGLDAAQVADTLYKCEEIIRGEPTNKQEIIELSGKLRFFEEKLGLTRRKGNSGR